MRKYDFRKIEAKWQKRWLEEGVFKANDKSKKSKFYQLETFPYPSAAGLHVGHPKGYIAEDVHARFMRMNGKEVLYTIGWDAFGLPTENYAIKVGKSPKEVAKENVKNFKRQVQMFGLSYDWDREINTSESEYYKWTQWLFIQLYKKGLAYRAKAKVNWCPTDMTVLANEQVVQKDGKNVCERCGAEVEQRDMDQWFLKITDYAERLLSDLKGLDWPGATIKRQEDWIGKSEGAEIEFPVKLEKSYTFLYLHGYSSSPDRPRHYWYRQELEKLGHRVIIPELPNSNNPTEEEQVKAALEAVEFNEDTILVGHSLGGLVAMKALMKSGKKIAGLVLIAPAVDPSFPNTKKKPFHKTFSWDIDYKKIKNLTQYRVILSDLQEIDRAPYLNELSTKLGAHLVEVVAAREHFRGDKEPEVLKQLVPIIKVFTTRPDTLFGATYLVLSPEHGEITNLKSQITNWEEVGRYIEKAKKKTELERIAEAKEKTGVELKGVKAINPATKEEIPVWVADYVLGSYGTGAIMAVPAHDERDFEFAKKFKLPIRFVIAQKFGERIKGSTPRLCVCVIIENNKGQILLQSKKQERGLLYCPPGGGVEDGEDFIESAKREVIEETGYTDFEITECLGAYEYNYFAPEWGKNRRLTEIVYRAVLNSEAKQDPKLTEKEKTLDIKHEWVEPRLALERMSEPKDFCGWAEVPALERYMTGKHSYADQGVMINSGKFDGMDSEKAKWEITKAVGGEKKIQYKIRDWSVSRQRYWGVPIPMVHCAKCGIQPVEEKELPVLLPDLEDYRPKGKPPLASSEKFIKTKCPKCGGEAEREPETLDTFVDSSWYYLRYTDPKNAEEIFDKKKVNHWMPVDLYVIGAEHTVLHLLYSRFITKFLQDEKYLKFSEPFLRLRHVGLIRGSDGQKMSKSRGNVVNPDELIEEFGADSFRVYEMFMGPFEDGQPWDPQGVIGAERFLARARKLFEKGIPEGDSEKKFNSLVQKTIKKVGEDIQNLNFNTAISALMILLNDAEKQEKLPKNFYENFLKLLHPFAPHMTQEIWEELGHKDFITFSEWPKFDEKLIKDESFNLIIQVNGKVRDSVGVESGISQSDVEKLVLGREKVQTFLKGGKPKKVIYVAGRLVNLVI